MCRKSGDVLHRNFYKRFIIINGVALALGWLMYRYFFVNILVASPKLVVTQDMNDIKDYKHDFNISNKKFDKILKNINKDKQQYYKVIYFIKLKNISSKASVGYFSMIPKFSERLKKHIVLISRDGLTDGVSDIGQVSEEIKPLSSGVINYFIIIKCDKKDKKELYKLVKQSMAKVKAFYSNKGIVGFTLYSGITSTDVTYGKALFKADKEIYKVFTLDMIFVIIDIFAYAIFVTMAIYIIMLLYKYSFRLYAKLKKIL